MAHPGRRERTLVLVATALAFAAFLVGLGISPPLSASPPDMASSQSLLGPEEQALVDLINAYRLEKGISPLIVSPTLTHAARWMSQDMAGNGYMNHTDSLGRDFRQRLADFGYDYNTYIGEDLARANDNYQTTFLLWQSSPGHEANMLSPNYRVIGVSRTHDGISSYGWYWVADFGGYDDSGVPPLLTIEPAPTPTPIPTPTPTPTPIPTPTPPPTLTPESESHVLPWTTGPASSHMEDDTLHNCPQPGSWAISVWNGADSTETGEVLDTCGEGNVDFAYYIDPDTQDWLHYFVGLTEFSDLPAVDNGQAVITHGAAGVPPPTPTSPDVGPVADKWTLWTEGTRLRGANIYQRRVYPELDDSSMGTGPVGPPYTQEDFDRLAALGANYVNISHPGLFSETPPYTLDQGIQDNLDSLLDMIAEADMFAVISFRTGPGRSEFTFFHDEVGTWFDDSYLNDSVWQDQAAQDGWVAMWRQTAERYRNNPIVAGYDLMVEPNANDFWLDIWEPEEFYPTYANTLYDWNQLHPRITTAIREVDADTPILIGGMSYSAVEWLPYLQPNADTRTVYTAHQYQPFQYTHQTPPLEHTYPGVFDTDWDGIDDEVGRAWLEGLLSAVGTFASAHSAPMAINEFGVMRWEPGAADFMDDQMDLFEDLGMNHALWLWEASWEPRAAMDDGFNFLHGPDPDHHADVSSSDLIDVIVQYWGRNTIRPSNFSEEATAQGTLHNCPQPGKWVLSVWTGADGTDINEAVASCTEATVAAAYWVDPQCQEWKHYFSALPEITTLKTLDWMQAVITLGKK